EFYERGELGGQIDNWCGPSPECLLSMCRSAGFAQAELKDITNRRASVVCARHWPDPWNDFAPPPAHLNSAANNRTYVAFFHPDKEEYICCYFKSAEPNLTVDSVFVEVDGFGISSLAVSQNGPDAWQVNCLRPPGLDPGRHEVRIRVGGGQRSNPVEIVMLNSDGEQVPAPARNLPSEAPELCSAEYHPSGDQRLAVNRAGSLICYFRSPAEVIGAPDLTIEAGNDLLRADILSSLANGVWQANVLLRHPVSPGTAVRVRLGTGRWSEMCRTI
ncbi:MAG: hypothetical protein QOJ99_4961, partial [Bryobacterales bacterium]|nr:hypothetical protein [Bryobacterales bacterium]